MRGGVLTLSSLCESLVSDGTGVVRSITSISSFLASALVMDVAITGGTVRGWYIFLLMFSFFVGLYAIVPNVGSVKRMMFTLRYLQ